MTQQSKSNDQFPAHGPWHDRFFKSQFETPRQIRSLLQLAIPPHQLGLLNLSSITIRKSSLPDAAELKEHLSDLIVEVNLHGGAPIVISILIEHKSGQDPLLMRQLLVYMARLYDNDASAVLPVTIYHGRARWRREKSFRSFQHDRLPNDFFTAFKDYLIDFKTIFVDLCDEKVRKRLIDLPPEERLALQAMAEIWEADEDTFASWLLQSCSLPRKVRKIILKSLYNYFVQIHQSVTIIQLEQALETRRSGAKTMQERAHLEEIIKEWNGVLPQTYAEAHSQGFERGEKRGFHQAVCEMAQLLVQDGMSDLEIQRYTKLSIEEIARLRNSS